jgi:hypothetical protein
MKALGTLENPRVSSQTGIADPDAKAGTVTSQHSLFNTPGVPESELNLELSRSQPDVPMEGLSKCALVTKPNFSPHLRNLSAFSLQRFAGRLDSELQNEGLWAHPKSLHELPVQLAHREMHLAG